MSINNDFINILMETIMEGVYIPNVQVERELSPILGIFIESLLTKRFENCQVFSGEYKLISPEFPLKKKDNNQSINVDYLLFNKTRNEIVFLELKTDSGSFEESQMDRYIVYKKRIEESHSASFLKQDIETIRNKSEKKKMKKKYEYTLDRINKIFGKDLSKLSKVRNCKVIYLVPSSIRKTIQACDGVDYVLSFQSLPSEINHKYSDTWKTIAKSIEDLDGSFEEPSYQKDITSTIAENIRTYITEHPELVPDKIQIGLLGKGNSPNYQVTFTNGDIRTFRFNGKAHHVTRFKDINLEDPITWGKFH